MIEKQTLKQAVNNYYSGKALTPSQFKNLQTQINQQNVNGVKPGADDKSSVISSFGAASIMWLSSLMVTMVLSVALFFYLSTPAIVSAAYADIMKDADLNNGIQAGMQQWLSENAIADVPQQYAVEMSRFCRLDQYLTTHLRIAGSEQGKLHLFFHQGKRPAHWLSMRGVEQKIHWRVLDVRDDLTLLVLYTEDMRKSAVEHILAEILPSLQA